MDSKFKTSAELMQWLLDGNIAYNSVYPNILYKLVDGELVYWASTEEDEQMHGCFSTFGELDKKISNWSKYIEPPKWYEDIRAPVLCWVSNVNPTPAVNIDLITGYSVAEFNSDIHVFIGKRKCWNHAIPMTDGEKIKYSPNTG